jgi:NADH-quinone oxidoreductase subunit G
MAFVSRSYSSSFLELDGDLLVSHLNHLSNFSFSYSQSNSNITLFQFCYVKNIFLPCFCYHEKLTIAGNCRMCMVEVNNNIIVACAVPLLDGMKIFTNNFRVKKARENVLELLLINHPLDCPICDQAGECDLQDITFVFGSDRGRFYEYKKRAVDNINCCGPFIKTIMTRCIHCTRCVRFLNEISGNFSLGVIGRGFLMEISTFLNNFQHFELSGNIIDLCPVGALTSMPYAFKNRSWELKNIESIDILDALASGLKISVVSNKIARILPLLNESLNED